MANSQSLLARLLNTPDLPAIIPRLQPGLLNRVIQACGLEDCSELVAHATPAQLAQVFDQDLWRARTPGGRERFNADRFAVWLAVLLEAGPDGAAEKLAGLDIDLVAGGLSQLVAVFDRAAVASYTTLDGEEMPGRTSTRPHTADVGGYAIEARRASAWDAIVELLAFLAADSPAYFHSLMHGCVRLSDGAREEDASHCLLDEAEQHMFDLGADRETRREQQGYVVPAQARAFLRSARDVNLEGDRPEPSPIARGYFRAFGPTVHNTATQPDTATDAGTDSVTDILRDAGVLAPPPRALLEAGRAPESRLAQIGSHAASHPESAEELAYLANVVVAGCPLQGRPSTEREAGDLVVATCNLGLENWPAHWPDRDLVTAFQVGWAVLRRDVCVYTSERLVDVLADLVCDDRDTFLALDRLRRELIRSLAESEPWRAGESLDVILTLDPPAWAALLGLIAECPVLHAALDARKRQLRAVDPADFTFISQNSDIAAVRRFVADLGNALGG